MDSTADLPLEQIGPHFEHHERFPRRTNTEFVEIVSPEYVKMRVWERGTGETLACGTVLLCDGGCLRFKRQNRAESDRRGAGRCVDDPMGRKDEPYLYDRSGGFVFDGELEYEV